MSGSSLNKVSIIARLTAKPEVVSFEGGRVAKFTVATNENWKNAAGEVQSKATFHRMNVFNDGLISVIEKYLNRGSRVHSRAYSRTAAGMTTAPPGTPPRSYCGRITGTEEAGWTEAGCVASGSEEVVSRAEPPISLNHSTRSVVA